ncbi:MAG: GH3 auxin-responsive promoter family protein, partial [Dehalococcoidales bacterium]|nr:GH3 auxin-responsive promoter family protein [Dehalococcoidales bacterium]
MSKIQELLRQGRYEELWQMGCGFIDLSLEQFMAIQKRLLLEQIELLKNCELGRKILRGAMPDTVEEFREQVPLTTYNEYCLELLERREDVLPVKPVMWMHTSGRSVEYSAGKSTTVKWVPLSPRFYHELAKVMLGCGLFASCKEKGDTSPLKRKRPKYLYAVAARPFTSGTFAYIGQNEIMGESLPPLDEAEKLPFDARIQLGFRQALSQGLDYFFGLSTVLIIVGERISQQSKNVDISSFLSDPRALFRLVKGLVKSKLAHRPILPSDLWSVKAIMGSGADSTVFKTRIKGLWGRCPLEVYAGTEGSVYATQTWDYDGMTFIPNLNFFEFIPEIEYFKSQLDHDYQPKTVLLDEVKAGGCYEVVITNFHGGIMTRYRLGDVVRVTSLRNGKLGIGIPQMVFESRADDLIDITGFGRLTEKVVWQAIENTSIPYADWTARKEVINEKPMLHLYLELKDNYIASERGIATAVYEQLIRLDDEYRYNNYRVYGNPEALLGIKPIKVALLPRGAFDNYRAQRQAEGADLAHLKPPH